MKQFRYFCKYTYVNSLVKSPSYSYVFNNPLLYVDGSGHWPELRHQGTHAWVGPTLSNIHFSHFLNLFENEVQSNVEWAGNVISTSRTTGAAIGATLGGVAGGAADLTTTAGLDGFLMAGAGILFGGLAGDLAGGLIGEQIVEGSQVYNDIVYINNKLQETLVVYDGELYFQVVLADGQTHYALLGGVNMGIIDRDDGYLSITDTYLFTISFINSDGTLTEDINVIIDSGTAKILNNVLTDVMGS